MSMEDVIKAYRCREPEERIPVLRIELDYELALLYDAMLENDLEKIEKSKRKLEMLRKEMLMLEAL